MIKLSVIMPVYNETLLEITESINSIINQTFQDFEFIIVDDNPKSKKLKHFLLDKMNSNKKIKLIFNHKNIGPSASTNKGVKYSKGMLIARMDADDISFKNRFISQIKFMNKYKLDICCFNYSLISESNNILKKQCYSRISQVSQSKIRHVMSYCNIANGPSFLFKRKLFNTLRGYRIKDIEDYDFASRALVYGFRLGYQSCPLMYKRSRSTSISNSHELIQFVELSIISKYLRKYHFHKIVPKMLFNTIIQSITGSDKKKFMTIKYYYKKLKNNKSIFLILKILCIIISSKLIIKYCIWSRLINSRQDKLIS